MRFILLVFVLTGSSIIPCLAQRNGIWQRTYGIPNRFDIINSTKSFYDNGFILGLTATINSPNEYLTWLIKTDINGNIMWSKSMINSDLFFLLKSLDSNEDGDIIITGSTNQYDENRDVFIMKVNACGEKVWCRVIRYPNLNYGYRVKIRPDGNYALYSRYAAPQGYKADKIWIFDTAGNNISSFYVVPPGTHPNIGDPLVEDFFITSDQGYLFSGSCYFPLDTLNPTMWRLQHLLVKVDSIGNMQWIKPLCLDTNHEGVIPNTLEYLDQFFAVGYDYILSKKNTNAFVPFSAYNGKFDFSGNLLFETTLPTDSIVNMPLGLKSMVDVALIQVAKISHNLTGGTPRILGVFKTDTNFTILKALENDTGSVYNECITSSIDGKFLITGYCPPESSYTEVDGLAIKVNSNLEYDSIYSFPFVYDSLCPFPILTDTIDCDCDIITGYGEPGREEDLYRLQIYPNPAVEKVRIKLRNEGSGIFSDGGKLILYDLFGKMIISLDIRKEVELDVSGLDPGIYLVAVKRKGLTLAREKLVVL